MYDHKGLYVRGQSYNRRLVNHDQEIIKKEKVIFDVKKGYDHKVVWAKIHVGDATKRFIKC